MAPVLLAGEVVLPEPGHHRRVERLGVLVLGVGGRVHPAVGHRVDQQLGDGQLLPHVPRPQAGDRGEVAARALAADGHPRRVAAQPGGVGHHPLGRRVGVLGGGRILVLRRLAVGDRDDDALGRVAEGAAGGLVDVEVGDHPAAAMEIDQHRERPVPLGGIDPGEDLAARRPGDQDVANPAHRLRHRLGDGHRAGGDALRGHLFDGVLQRRQVAGVFGGELLERRGLELGELVQDRLHV